MARVQKATLAKSTTRQFVERARLTTNVLCVVRSLGFVRAESFSRVGDRQNACTVRQASTALRLRPTTLALPARRGSHALPQASTLPCARLAFSSPKMQQQSATRVHQADFKIRLGGPRARIVRTALFKLRSTHRSALRALSGMRALMHWSSQYHALQASSKAAQVRASAGCVHPGSTKTTSVAHCAKPARVAITVRVCLVFRLRALLGTSSALRTRPRASSAVPVCTRTQARGRCAARVLRVSAVWQPMSHPYPAQRDTFRADQMQLAATLVQLASSRINPHSRSVWSALPVTCAQTLRWHPQRAWSESSKRQQTKRPATGAGAGCTRTQSASLTVIRAHEGPCAPRYWVL